MSVSNITTAVYNKPQSGTSVQKTLKDDVTTYFTKVAIGSNGTGSLVTSDGQSKGAIYCVGPQNLGGGASYLIAYPPQHDWLGAAAVSIQNINVAPGAGAAGEGYIAMVSQAPSVDLTAIQPNGINVIGVGSSPVGLLVVTTYKLSGSTASDITETPLPSGSFFSITANGTKSPVW